MAGQAWFGQANLQSCDCFAGECAVEIGLEVRVEIGKDFGEAAAKMAGDRDVVHLGQTLVDADVAQVAVEEAEADGCAVVDGMELGEALGGLSFEAQRHRRIGSG